MGAFKAGCSAHLLPAVLLLVAILVCGCATVFGYNLSPKANVIIKDPQLATAMTKVESSYFGFALSLRPLGIIIGAPRAQSTLAAQRNVNETGAIYRCSLHDKTCQPYVLVENGNRNIEVIEYTYDSEKRDHQWLGASIDGGPSDSDKLLVCAPRFIAPAPNDYLLHGICYWVNDTLSAQPKVVNKISPLRLKTEQVKQDNKKRFYYYQLAEMGLSAHVSANNEEFLIGSPGIYNWAGSIVRYRRKYLTDDPNLSRRDTMGGRVTRQSGGGELEPPKVYYDSEVPNPEKWNQHEDSYFGYSVGSGYFDSSDRKKLMYVATAPQANEQSGEAYVFDVGGDSINKHYIFRGSRFGEYFGYAILADDLNGDGLTDVVVSAPQYSISGFHDDGAIYVFINLGNFNFERKMIASPVHGRARFGTTLSKLGDINHDGFNDISVGAPFAGNGSVFVYLGNKAGLREQSSQRLNFPTTMPPNKYGGTPMFGHGLSKGADIDGNGFNDFAIGAPNAEAVFVYRAYPVVQILATIHSETREIKSDQRTFKVNVCYHIATTSTKVLSQDLALRVVVDPQVKRVKLALTNSNEMSFNVTAGKGQQCRVLDCDVHFSVADIFKPIELELHYDIINGVPDSEVFCETCAAVDPVEPKVNTEKIIFSTGCATSICIADLQLKSSGFDHTYTLGSSRTLTIRYDVGNNGETAYLPQINITSSNHMPFARIPSNCKSSNAAAGVLVCDLNRGQPMAKGVVDSISVTYDVSGISGKAMILTAEVFSTGNERTQADNKVRDVITLIEFTEIDVIGVPKTPHINLEKVFNTSKVINNYEVKSNGPSTVGALDVIFNIPVAYKTPGSSVTIPIIDMNKITMQAVYDAQLVGIDFYQNKTQIFMNSYERSTASSRILKVSWDSPNGMQYDSVKMGQVNEFSSADHGVSDSVMVASISRRRRATAMAAAQTASKDQYASIAHMKAHDLLDDDLKGTLPVNRTIVFNCNEPEMTVCVRAVMRVYNLKPNKPIAVNMEYTVDLKEVNQILIEPWEFFVVLIGLDVVKVGDVSGKSLAINKRIDYNIISKHQLYGTPIWVIILAIICGLLTLAILTYVMYRTGFFKRTTKEEMDKLVNQNQAGGDVEPEAQNLNSDRD